MNMKSTPSENTPSHPQNPSMKEEQHTDKQVFLDEQKKALENRQLALEIKEKELSILSTGISKGIENAVETGEKFGYFAEYAAYESAYKGIAEIVNKLESCLSSGDTLRLVHEKPDYTMLGTYNAINLKLTHWKSLLKERIGIFQENSDSSNPKLEIRGIGATAISALATKGLGILGALSISTDILKFFNSAYSIQSRDVQLKKIALETRLIHELKENEKLSELTVYHSAFMHDFPTLDSPHTSPLLDKVKITSDLWNELQTLYLEKKEAYETISPEIMGEEASTSLKEKLTEIQALLLDCETFLADILSIDVNAPKALLPELLRIEQVHGQTDSKYLYIEVASSGGEAIIQKGILSLSGSGIKYIGGSILSYLLYDSSGNILTCNSCMQEATNRYRF